MNRIIIAILVMLVLASGCASKKYVAPSMGRSGEQQLAISRAISTTLDQFDLSRTKGKTVSMVIRSLGQQETESVAVVGYMVTELRERVVKAGGSYVRNSADGDILLLLSVAVSGVNTTERDFTIQGLPLYALFVVKGYVKGIMVGYDRTENKFFALKPAEGFDERGVAYLLYLYRSEIKASSEKKESE